MPDWRSSRAFFVCACVTNRGIRLVLTLRRFATPPFQGGHSPLRGGPVPLFERLDVEIQPGILRLWLRHKPRQLPRLNPPSLRDTSLSGRAFPAPRGPRAAFRKARCGDPAGHSSFVPASWEPVMANKIKFPGNDFVRLSSLFDYAYFFENFCMFEV